MKGKISPKLREILNGPNPTEEIARRRIPPTPSSVSTSEPKKCDECNGVGWVVDVSMWNAPTCRKCKGTGRLESPSSSEQPGVSTSERGKHSAMIAALTPPLPTPASLTEALDELESSNEKLGRMIEGCGADDVYRKEEDFAFAARQSVISLFDAQQEENERLSGGCSGWSDIADNQTAQLSSQQARIEELEKREIGWNDRIMEDNRDLEAMSAELALLRETIARQNVEYAELCETALTPEEAKDIRQNMTWREYSVRLEPLRDSIAAKLSRIATQEGK